MKEVSSLNDVVSSTISEAIWVLFSLDDDVAREAELDWRVVEVEDQPDIENRRHSLAT